MADVKEEVTPEHEEPADNEHDPHFEPIISLPEVKLPTLEEDEIEIIKLRAKLFRYDSNESPPEWKERGTGDVKILRHKENHSARVLMRRDKTLKICANHFITPFMELKPNCGSDRAWVWSVIADYADETAKPELLAIRFGNAENANKWKDAFEEAKYIVATKCKIYCDSHNGSGENNDEDEESCESSDEANANGSVSDSTLNKTAENETAEALKKLNINENQEGDVINNQECNKVLNTDVNKNNGDLEKSNSTAKSIS